jgi:biliverdin reductase
MMRVRWGVLGVGRAGRARVEAIRAAPRSEVVGAWRGDVVGTKVRPFDSITELLQHVDAVAICSPDIFHADQVHTCLAAHRHVVCEFPLASSASEASNLYAMAMAKDRLLHVEHIELLTPEAKWFREQIASRKLLGGAVRFTGGARSNIASPAHANLARLHRVVDVIGMPDGVEVRRCTDTFLSVALNYGENTCIELECTQEAGQERHFELVLELEGIILRQSDNALFRDGNRQRVPPSKGLFKMDQLAATATILDGTPSTPSPERVLDVIGLADAIMGQA